MDATVTKGKVKESFFKKIAEKDLFKMLNEMGDSDERIIKFQKSRLLKSVIATIPFLLFAIFFNKMFVFASIGLGIFVWSNEYKRIVKFYKNFLFEKQLVFSKFTRMLIPYLLQSDATMYSVFNRILTRLEDGHVKHCLERLIIEMNEMPNSDEPFKKFARDASGTDSAILFMTTLYDYQQNTFDHSIINELGQLASEELFEAVDEIKAFKLKKFAMFPTKLTMASFIITLGYAAAMLTDAVVNIKL